MTGLLDRWGWDLHAPHVMDHARRHHQSAALLIVDLDHFKHINDDIGHPAGDAVLRATAHVLRTAVREADLVGRFGGDEFIVLLPGADIDQALAVARRISTGVSAIRLDAKTAPGTTAALHNLTASIGIAVDQPSSDNPETLLLDADTALRDAKRAGRATIRTAGQPVDPDHHDTFRLTPTTPPQADAPDGQPSSAAVVAAQEPSYWQGLYEVIHLLKGEWVPAILAALADGPRHFTEILSTIHDTTLGQPDSDRWLHDSILGRTLRRMEDKNLVTRHEEPARFPKSTVYELTPRAATLLSALAPAVHRLAAETGPSPVPQQACETHRRPGTPLRAAG
ncbi:diguanylate cyclase [Saccharothrix sp. NRRL B-16314]|uniref:diguanylate cyclase n=1 Tax=Saccharothrix sp. NRRL B-16314 TaxID=1463825 RepID=UPI00068E5A4E|nr:diguanylate cyclase [Saccharothrix sp. NRRL B-16314]